MRRQLYLYVEGRTEQTFASDLLGAHLAAFGVDLLGAVLVEFSRSKGKRQRGGVRKYEPFRRGLLELVKQHGRRDAVISTMIDLYALPDDFPGWAEAGRLRQNPPERVALLEKRLAEDIGYHSFIPYIQLHEFEALLFADPSHFNRRYSDRQGDVAALQAVTAAHASPEEINDDPATAPSKRILALFPDYEKVTDAVQIVEAVGLPKLRETCPHFARWLAALEALGQP